jgi:hypothetical protein
MQLDKSVKEYFDLFILYALAVGIDINDDITKLAFIQGLSSDDMAETKCFDIAHLPSIENIVNYLLMAEQFRRDIMG